MSVPDEYSTFCTKCDCYNISDIVCGDCVKELITQAHQAGIDEALENKIGRTLKKVASDWANWKEGKDEGYIYDEGYTFFEDMSRGSICSLLDEIEALQNKK